MGCSQDGGAASQGLRSPRSLLEPLRASSGLLVTRIFAPELITMSGSGDRDGGGGKDSSVPRSGKKLPEPRSKPVHDEDEGERLFGSRGADTPRSWNRNVVVPGCLDRHQVRNARRRRGDGELKIQESSKNLAKKVGIVEDDLLTGFAAPMMLVVLVEAFRRRSSERLSHLFRRTICRMRLNGFRLREFVGFLLSGSVASAFSEHGVHLLPMRWRKDFLLSRNSGPSCGLCKIYGAMQSVPLLWLEFSAIPSYFKSLHFRMLYLSRSLVRYSVCFKTLLPGAVDFEYSGSHESSKLGCLGYKPSVCTVERKESDGAVLALESVVQHNLILPDPGLVRHQKKRSSSRQSIKIRNRPLMNSQARGLKSVSCNWNSIGTHTDARAPDLPDNLIEPPHGELPEASDEFTNYKDENDVSTPLGSHVKYKRLNKNALRNVPPHVVVVPGVKEVSGCEDCATSLFLRPVGYIQTMGNEIQRALASEFVQYDMDSGDEDWLKELNLHSSRGKSDFACVSEQTFEKMIYTFEKDRYTNANDTYDREQALVLLQDFENRDLLAAIYDYWIEKRNRRNLSLVRVFQSSPLQRSLKIIPCPRRMRSLRRRQKQTSGAKPSFLEALVNNGSEEHEDNQEAFQAAKKAENDASRALATAIRLRARAETLMRQANLAVHKSVMACRIAEALQVSEGTVNLTSSILEED